MDERRWWENELDLVVVEMVLRRAGVLTDEDTGELGSFRERPWEWAPEKKVCEQVERLFVEAGIEPDVGWDLSFREYAAICAIVPSSHKTTEPSPMTVPA